MASPTHRKLLFTNSTTSTTTVQTCLYYCHGNNNTQNDTGFCPTPCLAICPSICHFSLSSLISPPNIPSQPNTPLQHNNNNNNNNNKNLSPLLITMLILLASVFLLITFYVLYTKLYFHLTSSTTPRGTHHTDHNNPMDEEHGPRVVFHPIWYIPTIGLTPAVINSIATVKYATTDDGRSSLVVADCAVCLAQFENEDILRVLPKCDHAFHIACIDTWLRSHTNCPLCRAPVVGLVEGTVPNSSQGGVGGSTVEEVEDRSRDSEVRSGLGSDSIDGGNDKVISSGGSCSQSQRWSLETGGGGGMSLVGRSLSCGAKIFSSRYTNSNSSNTRQGPSS